MLSQNEQLRYSRQIMLNNIGKAGQLALANAHVMIIGLGGLGNPVSLYLAAAGVGKLTIVDGDDIDITNLPRQILFSDADIGINKADSVASKLGQQYPECEIEVVDEMFDQSLAELYFPLVTLVIDCTDNIQARYLINQMCIAYTLPLIIGAATGFDGQHMMVDPNNKDSACYNCLYPSTEKAPVNNCQTTGVVGPILAIIGGMQALTAIKYITHNKSPVNQLSLFDGLSNQWQQFKINKQVNCIVCQSK